MSRSWFDGAGTPGYIEPLEQRTLLSVPSGFEDTQVANLNTTTSASMAFSPDGRLFVGDSSRGQIRVVKNNKLLATPALTLDVDHFLERGINGIVFDPNYSVNRYLYIYYTKPDPSKPNMPDSKAVNRLVRYSTSKSNPDVIDPGSAKVLLDNVPNPNGSHNGGALHFGDDGMLYLGIGEDHFSERAQDLSTVMGKVLRLNVADPDDLIPSDNPFAGQSGKRGEIWAYGFRNPFSGAVKPGTNTLFINDVGKNTWEEIDDVKKGGNYGWPEAEGNSSDPDFIDPIYTYNHDGTQAAIVGGAFYPGGNFPDSYKGKYFFGDYTDFFIKTLDPATKKVSSFAEDQGQLVDLDVAPDGTLWTLTVTGEIRRIRYVGSSNRAPEAQARATSATAGLPPLKVDFSADGSSDPDGDTLSYSWDFGDGASGSGKTVSHTYSAAGTYAARLTVRDNRGGADSADPITITVGDRPPVGKITLPAPDALYAAGQKITFSGSATDPEDGTLPASAYEWSVVFHHAQHTHPFQPSIPGVTGGTFTIPTVGETATDQWYRIHLKVTDASGVSQSSFVDIKPQLSTITLASSVPGLSLSLDGNPVSTTSPFSTSSVVGMERELAAPPTQVVNGHNYTFAGWSDGGAITRSIVTPAEDTTYTAIYQETNLPDDFLHARVQGAGPGLPGGADFDAASGTFSVTSDGYDIGGKSDDFNYLYKELNGDGQVTARLADMQNTNISAKAGVMIRETVNPHSKQAGLFITPGSGLWVITRKNTDDTSGAAMISGGKLPRWLRMTRSGDAITYETSEDGAAWTRVARSTIAMGQRVLLGVAVASRVPTVTNTALFDHLDIGLPSGQSLPAAAATYVRSGSFADANFGSDGELQVKRSLSGDNDRFAFLTFDISTLPADFTGRALLRMKGHLSTNAETHIRTGAYAVSDTTWSESSVTFNQHPAAGAAPVATVTVSDEVLRVYDFDLTDLVRTERSAGHVAISVALKNLDISDPFTVFASDDAADGAPALVVL